MKILILCTGNACRSQMAEGFIKSFDLKIDVYSAGTKPAEMVNPYAIQVMREIGLDISKNTTDHVEKYIDRDFDFVITVCNNAKKTCPVFFGNVKNRLHIGFNDPAETVGSEEDILAVFRRVRDEIKSQFFEFYDTQLKGK